MQLSSERRYLFPCPPGEVWAALTATDEYQRWWPWLRQFEAAGLVAGDQWRCTVRPPLPYSVRFTIELTKVTPREHVAARVTGDIAGMARIEISPHVDGSEVLLTSTLAPSSRIFAALARITRPIVTRGHDWVLDTGAAQFQAHLGPMTGGEPRRVRIGDSVLEATLVEVEGELDRAGWTGVLRDLEPADAMPDPDTELRIVSGPDEGSTAAIHVDQHFQETIAITGVSGWR